MIDATSHNLFTNNDNAQIMMLRAVFLAGAALVLTLLLAYSALDAPAKISPQGCRMSWMSPSYLLQTGFDRSWTPLAGRYSLWLYREVGWEGREVSWMKLSNLGLANGVVASWCTCAIHSWKRWLFAPSTFNRVLRDAPVLHQPI